MRREHVLLALLDRRAQLHACYLLHNALLGRAALSAYVSLHVEIIGALHGGGRDLGTRSEPSAQVEASAVLHRRPRQHLVCLQHILI